MAASALEDVRIALLGPVTVSLDGSVVQLPGGRARSLLAALALSAGTMISLDDIVGVLWDREPPAQAVASVYSLASRLRSQLGGHFLTRAAGGYRLNIARESVDLFRFRELVSQSRTPGGDELALLREAEALWRGTPLAGVRSRHLQLYEVPRIQEERLAVTERRLELQIAAGDYAETIGELRELTAMHPQRERLWAALVHALHLAGRQDDAYAAYDVIRTRLRDNLGADPGAGLAAELQCLLAVGGETVEPAPADVPQPHQLPPVSGGFVGRTGHLAMLDQVLTEQRFRVVVVDGAGGVGKTTLATHWAHQVADRFPDGQLYLNLRGFGGTAPLPTESALELLLNSVGTLQGRGPGMLPADVEARSALFRTRTAGRRMLVILDNAADTEQVLPLLPAADCLTVVTSRNQLRGLVVRGRAARVSVRPFSPDESSQLLADVIGRQRTVAEPDAATALADLCGHLPLALSIFAERAARFPAASLAALLDELRGPGDRLDAFDAGGGDDTSLRTLLSWSYEQLHEPVARTFRLLGRYPGDSVSIAAAAAVTGQSIAVTRDQLDQLTAVNLLEQTSLDRYELHDLLKSYAAGRNRAEDDAAAADRRLLDWLLHTFAGADRFISPGRATEPLGTPADGVTPLTFTGLAAALRWCETEYRTLRQSVAWAAEHGFPEHCCRIAWLLEPFAFRGKHWQDFFAIHHTALDVAGRNCDLRAHLLNGLANAEDETGEYHLAKRHFHEAIRIFRDAGNPVGESKALSNLALCELNLREYQLARDYAVRSLDICGKLGNVSLSATRLDTLAEVDFASGNISAAIANWRRALEINRRLPGHENVQAINLHNLGKAYASIGRHDRAVRCLRLAIELFRLTADQRAEALARLQLGESLLECGQWTAAQAEWRRATEAVADLDDPKLVEAQARLAEAVAAVHA
ncbi:AfsR/SARP family transcriptional regulator [Fodinicola acaciae]|uniref:AfsR/SARP family transcriptional regulator n=1 Tax=Fodinicola acaciae TaxID=2681555 RepID=UPI0013D51A23|nr:BTAD domain-containing putative transcriptional regulator [Fodinicola acaciae]